MPSRSLIRVSLNFFIVMSLNSSCHKPMSPRPRPSVLSRTTTMILLMQLWSWRCNPGLSLCAVCPCTVLSVSHLVASTLWSIYKWEKERERRGGERQNEGGRERESERARERERGRRGRGEGERRREREGGGDRQTDRHTDRGERERERGGGGGQRENSNLVENQHSVITPLCPFGPV